MMLVIFWLVMAAIVAVIASAKGRGPVGWFVYGFLIWPVALIHVLVVSPVAKEVERRALAEGQSVKCPHCAELIKAEAKVCRYCGRDIVSDRPSSGNEERSITGRWVPEGDPMTARPSARSLFQEPVNKAPD